MDTDGLIADALIVRIHIATGAISAERARFIRVEDLFAEQEAQEQEQRRRAFRERAEALIRRHQRRMASRRYLDRAS